MIRCLFVAILFALATPVLAACNGRAAAEVTESKANESDPPALAVDDVTAIWETGCDVVTPGEGCLAGLAVTLTPESAGESASVSVALDETKHLATVTVHTTGDRATSPDAAAPAPQTFQLGTIGFELGQTYDVVVVDADGIELFRGQFEAALAS